MPAAAEFDPFAEAAGDGGRQALGLDVAAGARRVVVRPDVERDALAGQARFGVKALAEVAVNDAVADDDAARAGDDLA